MKILEHFIGGKENNPDTCEDGLIMKEDLIAVIDGVTAKGTHLWNGKKSGCHAKNVLLDYLNQDIVELSAIELLENLNQVLKNEIEKCEENLSYVEYPRAVTIIYNDLHKEIWCYGDCQCSINGAVYTHSKKLDELNSDLRAFVLEYEIACGKTIQDLKEKDLGREAIQNNLLMQFMFENRKGYFGYPVLNGMGIETSMLKIYPVRKGDEVVLASDGYPILKKTLGESEEELDHILLHDPMCFSMYRATKGIETGNVSFDDRTFCRFLV